jgi:hypothetical protein
MSLAVKITHTTERHTGGSEVYLHKEHHTASDHQPNACEVCVQLAIGRDVEALCRSGAHATYVPESGATHSSELRCSAHFLVPYSFVPPGLVLLAFTETDCCDRSGWQGSFEPAEKEHWIA